jgi:hypothetical protein
VPKVTQSSASSARGERKARSTRADLARIRGADRCGLASGHEHVPSPPSRGTRLGFELEQSIEQCVLVPGRLGARWNAGAHRKEDSVVVVEGRPEALHRARGSLLLGVSHGVILDRRDQDATASDLKLV